MSESKTKTESVVAQANGAVYCWLDKTELQVDHTYQREKVRQRRIVRIADAWNWAAFGALIVSCRKDGTHWIIDGQHRWKSSFLLDHIQKLPCLVFRYEDVREEADAYRKMQTDRGPIHPVDRFKVDLVVEDEVTLAVNEMIHSFNYRVADHSEGPTVRGVTSVIQAYKTDREACRNAFSAVPSIFKNQPLDTRVFTALFHTERYLKINQTGESLSQPKVRKPLVTMGVSRIKEGLKLKEINTNNRDFQLAYAMIEMLNGSRPDGRRLNMPTKGLVVNPGISLAA